MSNICQLCGARLARGEFRLYGELVEIIFVCTNPKCGHTIKEQPLEKPGARKQAA